MEKGSKTRREIELTEEQCNQLIGNPFVHPVTLDKMEIGSAIHNSVMQQCSQILTSKNVAQEIMVHITNDTSIVAQDFCLAAVNNATSTNEIYDPLTKTKREITTVFSKTLLENCNRAHSIVFLHIQIDDDGAHTFIPFRLVSIGNNRYEVLRENVVNALKTIDVFIDKWASPDYHVNVATVDALIFGLTQLLNTVSSQKYVLKLKRHEKSEIMYLITRLFNVKTMAETGVHDTDRLPQHVKTQLKHKAHGARKKMAYKKEMDKNCDAVKRLVYQKYTTLVLEKYLSEFVISKTLDRSLKQFYADNNVNIYQDVVFEDVTPDNYIFLEDKHKQTRINENWLRRQHEYILSLSTEKLFNVYGYTHHGDEQVNNFLRGTFDEELFLDYLANVDYVDDSSGQIIFRYFPLFFPTLRFINMHYQHMNTSAMTEQLLSRHFTKYSPELKTSITTLCDGEVPASEKYRIIVVDILSFINIESWKSILAMYGDDLEDIIRNAPPTTEPMYLFRGVKTDYYLKGYIQSRKRLFKPRSFVSTSSSITVAKQFTDRSQITSDCCFMRIFVPARTALLLVSGLSQHLEESEFLLSKDMTFYIEKSATETFCGDKNYRQKMRVSDIKLM